VSLPVLVEAERSGWVESVHTGSLLAVRADGSVAFALGQVETPILPRSANKPLQAIGLLAAGWQPADTRELALACASHSGEPQHCDVVRQVLTGAGVDEDALGCPSALPLGEAAAHDLLRRGGEANRLTMNCSGKHAAMLACCVANGWPTSDYLDPAHPVQQAVAEAVERLAGEQVRHVAVDGCGAPQHALSLQGLARAFGRVSTDGGHCRHVSTAMREHPLLVGGTGREVSELLAGVPDLVVKDGAEGVYAAARPGYGAVAVKVADGASRAAPLLVVAGLRALGCTGEVLDRIGRPPVLGGGRPVGSLHVSAELADRVAAVNEITG